MPLVKMEVSLVASCGSKCYAVVQKQNAAGISLGKTREFFNHFYDELKKKRLLSSRKEKLYIRIKFWGDTTGWNIPRSLSEAASKNGWIFSYFFYDSSSCRLPPN